MMANVTRNEIHQPLKVMIIDKMFDSKYSVTDVRKRLTDRGFIKEWVPGRLTSCEDILPKWFGFL